MYKTCFLGDIYYKDAAQDSISGALQLGITHSIGSHQSDRDVLIQDFQLIETIQFPKSGTTVTPSHNFDDFRCVTERLSKFTVILVSNPTHHWHFVTFETFSTSLYRIISIQLEISRSCLSEIQVLFRV